MTIYKFSEELKGYWKKYPLRISGDFKCPRCNAPTILVQSMDGGYVTRNCPKCNTKYKLPNDAFKELNILIACPKCNNFMIKSMVDKNYGFRCPECRTDIFLSDILPSWKDISINSSTNCKMNISYDESPSPRKTNENTTKDNIPTHSKMTSPYLRQFIEDFFSLYSYEERIKIIKNHDSEDIAKWMPDLIAETINKRQHQLQEEMIHNEEFMHSIKRRLGIANMDD